MKKFLREFRDFIATGNVIDLAVAVVIGAAVKAVIDKFMEAVINPLIGAIVGRPNLDSLWRIVIRKGSKNESVIALGAVATQVVNLVMVGLVLFLLLRGYNRLRRPAPQPAVDTTPTAPAAPTEIELLTEIRDALRDR
jgi:large conductance mechanosensitive channel